jgi:hypothetical protein
VRHQVHCAARQQPAAAAAAAARARPAARELALRKERLLRRQRGRGEVRRAAAGAQGGELRRRRGVRVRAAAGQRERG